jgi:hypothetical protein
MRRGEMGRGDTATRRGGEPGACFLRVSASPHLRVGIEEPK